MNILTVSKLRKEFYGNLLYDHVSFELNSSDKVALIGNNGVGKTTLLKMIVGEETIDDGAIHWNKQASIGYLSQTVLTNLDHTLWDEMVEEFKHLVHLEKEIHIVSVKLEQNPHDEVLLQRLSRLQHTYESNGGYDYIVKIKSILHQFGFTTDMFYRKVETFSGGEKTRAAFAKLLLQKPNLLILDEPTNHLDLQIIDWLEEHLIRYDGAVLLVTHDKTFISRVCNKIIELDQFTSHIYHGNFAQYQEEKMKRYETILKQYTKQKKELEHLMYFVERFRYNAKRASIAQDRLKKVAKMHIVDPPKQNKRKVKLEFVKKRPTKEIIIEAESLSIGYESPLLKGITFQVRGFDKIAIIGPNGSGKTTLLKTLLGKIPSLHGRLEFVRPMKLGYFDQSQERLHKEKTIFQEIHDANPTMTNFEIRSVAARFLFIGDDLDKQISVLSGGEKVRLVLLLLMLERPDVLVLDEPTNHLDMETREIVEDVLEQFSGPILFVSHDRSLINRIATKLLVIKQKQLREFVGNYQSYKEMLSIEESRKSVERKKKLQRPKTVPLSKRINQVEVKIDEVTQIVKKMKDQAFLPEFYMDHTKMKEHMDELEKQKKLLYDLEQQYLHLLEELEREVHQ